MSNVLVVLPQHPVDIVNANMELKDFYNPKDTVLSVQMMALLAEETYRGEAKGNEKEVFMNQPYGFWNTLFLKIQSGQKLDKDTNNLFYGNYPKNSLAKFDHIISLNEYNKEAENPAWLYDAQLKKDYAEELVPLYGYEDIQFYFPTWKHLRLFLRMNGFMEGDRRNG